MTQAKTRQELYDMIRASSKDAVILDEMIRLGFWPRSGSLPNDPADEIKREAELQRELRALRTEQSRLYNEAKLIKELRKQRLSASREKKKATKERRLREREARKLAWAKKKREEIGYLGAGVSGGLGKRECDDDRLKSQGLPILRGAKDLADAMGVTVNELRFLAFSRRTSKVSHYRRFYLKKKSGGLRLISAPMPRLKAAQRWLLENVLDKVAVSDAAHGFRAQRGIVSNAAAHVGKDVVVNVDLQNFFPSVSYPRVRGVFRALGYSESASTIMALLTTEPDVAEVELDGKSFFVAKSDRHLPQGSPASPQLTNVLCRRLDSRLQTIAARHGFTYSRYADDLTFSGARDAPVGTLLAAIRHAVRDAGFVIHPNKTQVMRRGRRQEVTGVVVNDKVNIPRRTLRKFRAALHQLEKNGVGRLRWNGHEGAAALSSLVGYASFIHAVDKARGRVLLERARRAARANGWVPVTKPALSVAAPLAEAPTKTAPAAGSEKGDNKKWWKLW